MDYEFKVYQMQVDDHIFWVAESKSLRGCVGQGDTAEDAIRELEENEKEWIITANEVGIPIPAKTIRSEKSYSGKIALRVSPFVHEEAADIAKEQGISVNQLINDALTYYLATLKAKSASQKYWKTEQNTNLRIMPSTTLKVVVDQNLEVM